MQRILTPVLVLSGLGLLAVIFFVDIENPWKDINVFWLMAFVFHVPFLLFVISAITAEIRTLAEKKSARPLKQK